MARPERSHLEAHYADLSSKGFFAGLIDYMVSERKRVEWSPFETYSFRIGQCRELIIP